MTPTASRVYEDQGRLILHEGFDLETYPVLPYEVLPGQGVEVGDNFAIQMRTAKPTTAKALLDMQVGLMLHVFVAQHVLPAAQLNVVLQHGKLVPKGAELALWRNAEHDWEVLLRPDSPCRTCLPDDGYRATFHLPFRYQDVQRHGYIAVNGRQAADRTWAALADALVQCWLVEVV